MVVVHLTALGLVVVTHVAAAPTGLPANVRQIFLNIRQNHHNLQTLLHPESLSVVVHIDDVFPHTLSSLASLRFGVLDL